MDAKAKVQTAEPCVGCSNLEMDEWGYLCDLSCGKRTAWLNYQAGIMEVVEWMKQNSSDSLTNAGLFQIVLTTVEWQAKLKEWGITEEK